MCFYCFKDKKAAKEREREERIAEAELENVHSARNVEAEKLKEILAAECLLIKEVCHNVQQFQCKPDFELPLLPEEGQ